MRENATLESYLETGDLGNFRIYDPAAMNWYHEAPEDRTRSELRDWISWRDVLHGAWGLAWFYGGLMLITLLAVGALFLVQILSAKTT